GTHSARPSSPTRRSSDLRHGLERLRAAGRGTADGGEEAARAGALLLVEPLQPGLDLRLRRVGRIEVGLLGFLRDARNERAVVIQDRKSTRLNSSHVKISY